jgi:lipopolysaccharide transport system ATP-binding protein
MKDKVLDLNSVRRNHRDPGEAPRPVISAKGVSKKFSRELKQSMLYGSSDLLSSFAGRMPKTFMLRSGEFWALDDISLECAKGRVLGVVGPNGSGKTTLLRVLAGIYPPDKGEVRVKGRVATINSYGAGFHPHMSGLDNIYLNGAVLGMSAEEIDSKLESIVSFSGVGEFLHSPVAAFSSGMKVRLGFSIAISLEPDVLLLDEVLAVGDTAFRKKCYGEIEKIAERAAVIFVSNKMSNIEKVCTDIMVLEKGRVAFAGNHVSEGIEFYDEMASQ